MATTFGIPLGHEQYMKARAEELETNWKNKDKDMVNSPAHYAEGDIETIDYIVDVLGEYEAISYCHGNLLKYTGSRLWKKGNPIEDAEKAAWYLDKMIELMKRTKGVNW
jgi:hypothetical protein